MTILVLGGAGYIGAHVVRALEKDHMPIIVDNLTKGHAAAVGETLLIKEDIRNTNAVRKILLDHQVNAVVHLAADSLVGESMKEPARYYNNNVYGTLSL